MATSGFHAASTGAERAVRPSSAREERSLTSDSARSVSDSTVTVPSWATRMLRSRANHPGTMCVAPIERSTGRSA